MYQDRIRMPSLLNRVMSADEAAGLIQDGMVVGMSGFTRAGDAKDIPVALARRAQQQPLKITLITGASLGHDSDKILVEAGVLARRMPFQVDTTLRAAINRGEVMFTDQHLSETVEFLRAGQYGDLDVAVLEAVAITEDGGIVPSSSVGNSASFAILAKKIIIELNLAQPRCTTSLSVSSGIWTTSAAISRKPARLSTVPATSFPAVAATWCARPSACVNWV